MSTEIISLREFARRLNVGEKTIRDGVRLGKISKGVINENGKPKINYSIALKEVQDIGLGRKSPIKQPETRKQFPTYPVLNEFLPDGMLIYSQSIQLEKARLKLEIAKSQLEISKIELQLAEALLKNIEKGITDNPRHGCKRNHK